MNTLKYNSLEEENAVVANSINQKNPQQSNNKGEIIVYQPDNSLKLAVRLEDETVWLTQAQMVLLFERDRTVITKHISNIFQEKELEKESNVHFLHIANNLSQISNQNLLPLFSSLSMCNIVLCFSNSSLQTISPNPLPCSPAVPI